MTNSRRKGKEGELELKNVLNDLLGTSCSRSQQYCGANGDADVVGLEGIHIECKRVENLNIYKAIDQAQSDARDGELPCVFHRRNRKQWLVTMPIEDWCQLYREGLE